MPYYVSGKVTLGVWAKKAGVWSKITNKNIFITVSVGGAGPQTYNWDATWDTDLGPGVQAFGITIESVTGDGGAGSATLSDFVSATWQALSSSGERSATPSGQLSRVTVRPQ